MPKVESKKKVTWLIVAGALVLAGAVVSISLFKDSILPVPVVEEVSPEARIAAWRDANPPNLHLSVKLDPKSGLEESEALVIQSAVVLARYLATVEQFHPPKRLPSGGIDLLLAGPDPETLERLHEMIRGGYLGFHLVHPESGDLAQAAAMGNAPPAGYRLLTGGEAPLLIERDPVLTGAAIASATLAPESGDLALKVTLNEAGGERLAEITAANIGRRLAMVSRDRVLTAPVIQAEIGGGTLMISGGLSPEEAQALSLALDAGGLPAPLLVTAEEAIAP